MLGLPMGLSLGLQTGLLGLFRLLQLLWFLLLPGTVFDFEAWRKREFVLCQLPCEIIPVHGVLQQQQRVAGEVRRQQELLLGQKTCPKATSEPLHVVNHLDQFRVQIGIGAARADVVSGHVQKDPLRNRASLLLILGPLGGMFIAVPVCVPFGLRAVDPAGTVRLLLEQRNVLARPPALEYINVSEHDLPHHINRCVCRPVANYQAFRNGRVATLQKIKDVLAQLRRILGKQPCRASCSKPRMCGHEESILARVRHAQQELVFL
mmetsp:Transcript_33754/g.60643  ORF Transcript_33754/g.60643 Transcript_33754/m.60643 type:complete len:264 (-) Transcript_33754:562-1353(-)